MKVDSAGVRLPAGASGSFDVFFDDHHAWSFSVAEGAGETVVGWPGRMQRFLTGASRVALRRDGEELYAGEVDFGGPGRVSFLDKHGIPVMIDKWGLLQRPFSARGAAVVDEMVDLTERILDVLATECGVRAWIAFGTLLGAAREGRVIGHDSDVDLAYLSTRETLAEMARELFEIGRTLRRHGMRVVNKSASFITVTFKAPDGAMGSIDLYTCFYLGDRLYETATVGAVVPRSAIEPLGELEFEGRMLPAPADPDAMLRVSYGPRWRVPDPSFRHEPPPELVERFDGWFSSLMRGRRDWESHHAEADDTLRPSRFARWVASELPAGGRVIEVGTGRGADALHLARRGWSVVGLDYARGSFRAAQRKGREEELDLSFTPLNLLDLRDTATRAALLVRREEAPRAVVIRGLVEALDDQARENLWRFVAMVLRGGGRAYLEGRSADRERLQHWRAENGGGRLRPVDPRLVEGDVTRAGGQVVLREGFPAAAAACRGAAPARWRMVVEWEPHRPVRSDQGAAAS